MWKFIRWSIDGILLAYEMKDGKESYFSICNCDILPNPCILVYDTIPARTTMWVEWDHEPQVK